MDGYQTVRVTFEFTVKVDVDPAGFAERVFDHMCADEYDEIPELFSVDSFDPPRPT